LLLELAGDELDRLRSLEDQQQWIQVVALAWNLELLERVGDHESCDELVAALPDGDAGAKVQAMIDEIVRRKIELCSGDDRLAIDPQLVPRKDGLLLRVRYDRLGG
jgi:hypothetical protein